MTFKSLISAALIIGCYSVGANAQMIGRETYLCGQAAAKAGAKFSDKVADSIEGCLLQVMNCNQEISIGEIQSCVDALLVPGGKCAKGKLAPAGVYYGGGSLANIDLSLIGKAYKTYNMQLSKCDPALPIDYTALDFPNTNPASLSDLVESLNADGVGPACAAHRRVYASIPAVDSLLALLQNSVNSGNLPLGVSFLNDPFNVCK